jgi:phenylpropionate dioxygenase-like ring-hydroxylating dioxygenase large terminal subunit
MLETPTSMRAKSGAINAFENRCAHRGVAFCYTSHGNAKAFQCPYHQWTYDLKGKLCVLDSNVVIGSLIYPV